MTPTVLFVHAHPDDESITTGGTLAQLVRAGARVTVLTATRGEGGEVIGSEFAQLEGDRPGLAAHREGELAAAMRVLGVSDHRYLGSAGGGADASRAGALAEAHAGGLPVRRFEDSGMEWGADGHAHAPASMPPAALCAAELETVAAYVRAVIEDVDPHLVITYASGGGYGHPDHRRVHDATVAALHAGGSERGLRTRLLTIVNPPAAVAGRFDASAPGFDLTGFAAAQTPSTIADDVPVAVAQDVHEVLGLKAQAMAAHATQVRVAGEFFALSNGVGQRIDAVEHFALVDPRAEGTPVLTPREGTRGNVLAFAPQRAAEAGAADFRAASEVQGLGVPIRVSEGTGAAGAESAGAESAATGASGTGETGQLRPRREKPEESWTSTLGGCLHGLVIGLVVGVLGSFQHLNAFVWHMGDSGVIVPWGLALALLLTAVGLWHITALYRSSLVTVVAGATISAVGFALAQPGFWPAGDLVVTGSLRSLVWLFAPMLLAAVLVFASPGRKRRG